MQSNLGVSLRKFTKDDITSYYDIAQDKKEYFPFGYCRSKKIAKDIIEIYIDSQDMDAFAIINGESKLVGVIILEYRVDIVQISYFVGIQHRRKGYCMEAIKLAMQKVKNKEIKKMEFFIHKDNLQSIIVAEKIGAKVVNMYNNFIVLQKNI